MKNRRTIEQFHRGFRRRGWRSRRSKFRPVVFVLILLALLAAAGAILRVAMLRSSCVQVAFKTGTETQHRNTSRKLRRKGRENDLG